ncbi:MAG TPA: type II toxin-antitoxin system RelE/ParE family toxin [Gemmataceae bacterium]|nr:type II toxin-antitoxin system RelE/ParE family toxin [Gemmataceae bacterium]
MLPVVQTQRAEQDMEEILSYLEEHSPPAAERFAVAFNDRCRLLGQFPEMGRLRNELRPGVRSVVIEKYVALYKVTESSVVILRIVFGARDLDSLLSSDDE